MRLMKLGDGRRYLNMTGLIEAEIQETGTGIRVILRFVAPSPVSLGASDWGVEPYEVTLAGEDATTAMTWLRNRWEEQP